MILRIIYNIHVPTRDKEHIINEMLKKDSLKRRYFTSQKIMLNFVHMKKFLIFFALSCAVSGANGAMPENTNVEEPQFDEYFCDTTLRIDYEMSGDIRTQHIAIDELCRSPHWYGRRHHLNELPIEGNGQITMRDHKSGRIIYRTSFSTLFQEWLAYPEANHTQRSFENVFIMPMPKDTADVTIDLRNYQREIMTTMTHQVVPNDILIRHIGEKDVTPWEVIQLPRDTTRCIHLAYMAEGYQPEEMGKFINDAHRATDAIFSHEPFKSMRDRFYIVAVKSPSKESGAGEPGKGIWKNTALGSHWDTFYSERYLTTSNLRRMHDWLAGIPYEHIIALVNSKRYGGGGIYGEYLLSTIDNEHSKPVVVHEFGHSFCGLADEYAYEGEQVPMYPTNVEPWEKNITTKVNFKGKWENIPDAGFYEGAGYTLKGVWRAYPDCRMRTNENPHFCKACQKAIKDFIDFYTK